MPEGSIALFAVPACDSPSSPMVSSSPGTSEARAGLATDSWFGAGDVVGDG